MNHALFDEAETLVDRETQVVEGQELSRELVAVVVWEGHPQRDFDLTAEFAAEARARGMDVDEIMTM